MFITKGNKGKTNKRTKARTTGSYPGWFVLRTETKWSQPGRRQRDQRQVPCSHGSTLSPTFLNSEVACAGTSITGEEGLEGDFSGMSAVSQPFIPPVSFL